MRYCQFHFSTRCLVLLFAAVMYTLAWGSDQPLAAATIEAVAIEAAAGPDEPAFLVEANLEDAWYFVGEADECRLEAQFRDYGVARFLAARGGSLHFELIGHRDLFARGSIDVYQSAPEWHPHHPAQQLLGQALHVSGGSIVAADPVATRMLMGLFEGYDLSLTRDAWFSEHRRVGVKLVSVGVRDNYAEFTDCFSGPLLQSWSQVERTRIGYTSAGWALDEQARQQLESLAEYVAADPSVVEVFIDGHTDESGSQQANLELARRRAESVANYLATAGVAREMLVVRYHGGRYPVANNDDESGRAENRRVTIRLERNWSELVSR